MYKTTYFIQAPILSIQSYCLSPVYYKICQTTFVHLANFAILGRDRPPLNVFDVNVERRE